MSLLLVCSVSLAVSVLTLFSGFGLGTLLMPAFAVFFPVEVAIAATAVVHLINNLVKVVLVGKWADPQVTFRFALPAGVAAAVGAWLLMHAGWSENEQGVRRLVGGLIIAFALVDLAPGLKRVQFASKYVPIGGLISGFFGGISGHQGALRSLFLIRAGLSKEAFIGTTVLSAVVVDVVRLTVYGTTFFGRHFETLRAQDGISTVAAASLAAIAGSVFGAKLVGKIELVTLHLTVAVLLLLMGSAMVLGWL